jgi:adenylate kinase family enzyme
MQRVLVIGCSGAGKSTLSRKLAARTGLPLIDLDFEYWRPGWVKPPNAEWLARVGEFCARPAWVMDGNYASTLNLRVASADTIVWLDYPRRVCLARVLWRSAKDYGRVREGGPQDCPERLDLTFLRYTWNFNRTHRPRVVAALDQHGSHVRLHHLKSDRDARRLLASAAGDGDARSGDQHG